MRWPLAAAIAVAFGAPAKADGVKVGVLTCHESSGWGFIFGSSKGLHCVYHHGGYSERYNGDVTKFGVDIGYTSERRDRLGRVRPELRPGARRARG